MILNIFMCLLAITEVGKVNKVGQNVRQQRQYILQARKWKRFGAWVGKAVFTTSWAMWYVSSPVQSSGDLQWRHRFLFYGGFCLFVCLFVCFQDTSQIHLAVSQSWSFLLAPTQWPAVRSAQSRKFCSLSLQLTPCLWALVLESSKVESKVPTRSRSTPKPRKHNLRLCRDFCTRSALSSIISRILQV